MIYKTHLKDKKISANYKTLIKRKATTEISVRKGCYCQMGSIFRAIISLIFILGVSAGLFYWLYVTQFRDLNSGKKTTNDNLEKGTKKINNNIDIEEDYILRANELLETFRLEFVKRSLKKIVQQNLCPIVFAQKPRNLFD